MPRVMRAGALFLTGVFAVPLAAQFNITTQINGQASSTQNGGAITFNAPSVGQSVTANVTVTYLGTGTVTFPSAAQLFGSTNFSDANSAGPQTLTSFQSTNIKLIYTPTDAALASGQFSWPYTQNVPNQTSSGAIILNLAGTAPNPVLAQVTANGNIVALGNAGTVQFSKTVVNTQSTATIDIINTGSGPATVNSISVAGPGFALEGAPLLPITIAPNSQVSVTVQFLPATVGPAQGTLQVSYGSGSASAQLSGLAISSFFSYQLTTNGQTTPLAPLDDISFGDVALGTTASATVTFQNVGSGALALNFVGINGTGFSVSDAPFLPQTLQPNQFSSVTVTFTPPQAGPFTGRLQIGSDMFTLSGRGLGAVLQFSSTSGGVSSPVSSGGTLAFNPIQVGQKESLQFSVTNTGTAVSIFPTIGLTDSTNFELSGVPALPLQLQPGATTALTLTFAPRTAGQLSSTLSVGGVNFPVTGSATAPALPAVQFTGASGVQQPFQQPAIGLKLASAYPLDIAGTLTLSTVADNFATDPAVQFSTGGRQVPFTIPANTLQAIFPGGSTQIRLQTGTVTGTIVITAALTAGTPPVDITPAVPPSVQLTVPATTPVLLTASISARSTNSLSISVTGYSSSRSLDHLTFQLVPAAGVNIATTTATVDVSSASAIYFRSAASQNAGGQFTVDVPFTFSSSAAPVTGTSATTAVDLTKNLGSITVTASSSIGTSNLLTVIVP